MFLVGESGGVTRKVDLGKPGGGEADLRMNHEAGFS
jgi:hypothetical protein